MLKALLLSLALSNGLDAGTSIAAFRRGAVELNPLVISRPTSAFVAQVSAATAGELWLASKLNAKHPRLTRTLLAIGIGAGVAVSVNNIRVYNALSPTAARR